MDFSVSPEKNKQLRDKMSEVGLLESDLQEKFVRASGPGGQKVNKTSSCVYLKHMPTGLEVKCMAERSQSLNRFFARREMVQRLEALVSGKKTDKDKAIEKIRKQKAQRKRAQRKKAIRAKAALGETPPDNAHAT